MAWGRNTFSGIFRTALDAFLGLISSPIYFFLCIILTVSWLFFQAHVSHPIDKPADFYPLTVLGYTLWGLWVENAVKLQQGKAAKVQAEQMSQLVSMQQKLIKMQDESRQRDLLVQELVTVVDSAVDTMIDMLKVHLSTKGGAPKDEFINIPCSSRKGKSDPSQIPLPIGAS